MLFSVVLRTPIAQWGKLLNSDYISGSVSYCRIAPELANPTATLPMKMYAPLVHAEAARDKQGVEGGGRGKMRQTRSSGKGAAS